MEGFQIVRAILCKQVDAGRIGYRDTQNYFGILLDGTNRKPICRLFLNGSKKYFITIHADKSQSEKIEINSVEEFFRHEELFVQALRSYLE